MSVESLKQRLADQSGFAEDAFAILTEISRELAAVESEEGASHVRELVIRACALRDSLDAERKVVDALVRKVGLYPYLPAEGLSTADALALEMHRPLDMPDPSLVFHPVQAELYRRLLDGENLIVAAPTSFGKSLVIDALIASGRYGNVVIVVPTIALIDETRIRLSRFRQRGFTIITHASQLPGDRNLFVMTQERVLEHPALPDPDLLVVDEFYKLDPTMDPERSSLLNQAFYRLLNRSQQFYLLGPSIGGLAGRLPKDVIDRFVSTDYATVALDSERIDVPREDRARELVRICRDYDGPTLIYCNAPGGCRRVVDVLMEAEIGRPAGPLVEAADWLAEHVDPDWALVRALRNGIGIHHGQMPRWLGQYAVRAFNSGELDYLVCTSTLIEGVNTSAKNVVVYEKRLGAKNLDLFAFNNIRGRAGRMRRHFVGRVFHFDPAPQNDLVEVDIPVLSQPEDAPIEMLLELDAQDRSDNTQQRIEQALGEQLLPEEVLKLSPGISVGRQGALARELAADPEFYEEDLGWNGIPTTPQLRTVCNLIWDHLIASSRRRHGVRGGDQLMARVTELRNAPSVREMVTAQLARRPQLELDAVVDDTMEFLRHWQEFEFPRLLRCTDHIQRYVFGREGLMVGDYRAFASQVEAFFTSPYLSSLDEYGIPLEVAKKLERGLTRPSSLDDLLRQVAELELDVLQLTPFERTLVDRARDTF